MRTFNEFQTELTDELLASLEQEVKDELFDILNNVEFVKRLVSPDRKRAKDLERDEEGKIIVDILDPHILENMEYFRPAGNHFKKYGVYTQLKPNGNPNSEFGKWLKEEIRRSWEGYIRPSDGEWITGDMYFYLNYSPIQQTKVKKGKKKGERITDLPEVWEGIYLRYHYWHQASKGGKYDNYIGGKMAAEIAKRGSSKSYCMASSLTKHFLIGESAEACREIRSLITAYQKEYLVKDGTLNKFVSMIDFNAEYTEFPAKRLKSSFQEMTWKLGYLDANTGVSKGLLNEVIGVSSRDDTDKIRGKRATKIFIEEFGAFPKISDIHRVMMPSVSDGDIVFGQIIYCGTGGSEGCLTKNNLVHLNTGEIIPISKLTPNHILLGYDTTNNQVVETQIKFLRESVAPCVKITTNNLTEIECTLNHPIFASNKSDSNELRIYDWIEAGKLKQGNLITFPNKIAYFGTKEIKDPRLIGLLIGDGSYGEKQNVCIHSCDIEILDYVKSNYNTTIQISTQTKDDKQYECLTIKGIRDMLRQIGIYGQTKNNKRLPIDFSLLTKEQLQLIVAGLFDTDGNVSNTFNRKRNTWNSTISMASSCLELVKEIKLVLQKLGIYSKIQIKKPSDNLNKRILDKNEYYSLEISDRDSIINFAEQIDLLIEYKRQALLKAKEIVFTKKSLRKNKEFYTEKIKSVEYLGEQTIYNLTTNAHTYLANGVITHNSDFSGALDMMYNPKGFDIYALPNIYDKNSQGKVESIFFFGAYLNKKPYYNEDGVSDVIAALISILQVRFNVKYNSADVTALTRTKAENPITIQEAIMKRDSTIYPVSALTDVENDLNVNPHLLDDIFVCSLEMKPDGSISPKPEYDNKPIREFPHQDNKLRGACEIYKLPELSKETNKPVSGRYIAGIDTYDDDSSDTLSLGSILIMDSWTDMIVFEYTGRPMFADDFYEICRRALLFYNARANYENNKKGLFAYFSRYNSLYLLTDVLEFLKDKDLAKGESIGNKTKGTNSTEPIKKYSRVLNRNWLLKEKVKHTEVDGVNTEVTYPQLQDMRQKALIKELCLWNADGNFDRHDALSMVNLLREDRMIITRGMSGEAAHNQVDKDYLGIDPFFEQNYKSNKSSNNNNILF